MPMTSAAARCSRVCGWGHGSSAAITRIAPSIIAAPESIVAISASCPGASTKLTARMNSASDLQFGHVAVVEYACGVWHFGHL